MKCLGGACGFWLPGKFQWATFAYLLRFHLSRGEVFDTVQKAAFRESVVGSQELLKLETRGVLRPSFPVKMTGDFGYSDN